MGQAQDERACSGWYPAAGEPMSGISEAMLMSMNKGRLVFHLQELRAARRRDSIADPLMGATADRSYHDRAIDCGHGAAFRRIQGTGKSPIRQLQSSRSFGIDAVSGVQHSQHRDQDGSNRRGERGTTCRPGAAGGRPSLSSSASGCDCRIDLLPGRSHDGRTQATYPSQNSQESHENGGVNAKLDGAAKKVEQERRPQWEDSTIDLLEYA
jgi:hypothetical protein